MSTNSLKDKTAKGLLWGALNSGAMQVLNAVFGIVLARRLSQDDYGLIGMLTIFSLIAGSLQDSGFVTALTNRRNATFNDYNAVFWFNVMVSLLLYVVFFFCAPLIATFFDEPLLTNLSRYYFFGFLIASFSIVPRAILFRQIKQRELAIMSFASLLVSGSVGIAMAYNDMAYWGLATQSIVFNLMVTALSWRLSHWHPRIVAGNDGLLSYFKPIREMFGFSSKMLITNIFIHINNNIFSLVLGRLYTKVEVGTYTQANKWNTMGASTITGMVQGVAQPMFVQVGDDRQRLCRAFGKMLRFTCFVSFPVMFGLALVAPEFITLLLTAKWMPSAKLMQMLCVAGAFLPIATLYFNLIIARGRSDVYMWNILAQGITLLTAIVAIHLMGGGVEHMVAGYAAIVILWTAVWHYFLQRETGYSFLSALRDAVPFMFFAAVAMLATYLATQPLAALPATHGNLILLLIVRIVLAAIIYVGALWVFGAQILRESLGYLSGNAGGAKGLMRKRKK